MSFISKRLSSIVPAMRISFALVLLTVSLLLVADFLNFVPSERHAQLQARKTVGEALAIQFSVLTKAHINELSLILNSIVKRNNTIVSAGIRNQQQALIFSVGNHLQAWGDYKDSLSTPTNLVVPILENGQPWGAIEIKFQPLTVDQFPQLIDITVYKLIIYILVFGFVAYFLFILRTLRELDPTAVIPGRVSAAFDTLAEGVLILDQDEQIVLANRAFSEKTGKARASLIGVNASHLNWKLNVDEEKAAVFPWSRMVNAKDEEISKLLKLVNTDDETIKFSVNSAPIFNEKQEYQGVLVTFDDITELEEKNAQLEDINTQLTIKEKEAKERNKELHYLATRDPLTGCLNRRAFYDAFGIEFKKAKQSGGELSCIMADIDHFKRVNDNYGHSTGDEIIKLLADILQSNTRKMDLVGRYGGEEFCIVLPGLSVEEAVLVAERIRLRIKDESIKAYGPPGPNVTASLGVASIFDHGVDPAELNDQADKALYVAKESGRNQVVRWSPAHEKQHDQQAAAVKPEIKAEPVVPKITLQRNPLETEGHIKQLESKIQELEGLASQFSYQLQQSQHFDGLTGLPNQSLFYDRIEQAISRGQRYDYIAAVLTIDVSLFNRLNTSLGRAGGDIVLKRLADRLAGALRDTDGITILNDKAEETLLSRFGADEFGILLSDLESRDSATWIIKRIFDTLSMPIEVKDQKVFINCSVGVSLFPFDAEVPEKLIQHALTAKQFAKQLPGQNNFQYFNEDMQALSEKHVQLEIEIRRAIENQEWQLYYQPKIHVATKTIKGVEAMIRWQHPQRGILSPAEFLDFAEQRGYMNQLGEWTIREACAQAKEWIQQGIKDITIAVNIASPQLLDENLPQQILKILDDYELPPRYLSIEITETSLIKDMNAAISILNRIHCRGITIALDDFGTGYSSLSYLKKLPIDILKIDQSFVANIMSDESDKNIVAGLVSMAHNMGIDVVAEGVENQAQYDILKDMACDHIQGYLLCKPLPAKDMGKILKNGLV